jgi:hypothetical protein
VDEAKKYYNIYSKKGEKDREREILVTICSPSFRLPPNFASLSYDRKDDVRSFRLYVGDILKEVCGVLGPGAVLPPLVYDLIAQVTIYFSHCLSLSFFLSLSLLGHRFAV